MDDFGVRLPTIRQVVEVYEQELSGWPQHARAVAMIAPDPMAGRKHRYSVIRLYSHTGQVVVIGREVDLKLARILALRPVHRDGKPVTDADRREAERVQAQAVQGRRALHVPRSGHRRHRG